MKSKTEEFIKRSKIIHGDRYNYSNSIYIGGNKKIKILCLIHGEFSQDASEHLRGKGCKKCAGKWCNTEEFIERAKNVHGNKYDYSLVDYKNNLTKIKIICPQHGEFMQIPKSHFKGQGGCLICSRRKPLNNKEFIIKAKETHKDKYDYSLINYKNKSTKVKIICPKHGVFEQSFKLHISKKCGCPNCAINKLLNVKEFIERAKNVHGNKYDYSLLKYKNSTTKVKIICKEHGVFEQTPSNHTYQKQGCIICSGSAKSNTEEFIKKAKLIHVDKYDYSKVIYNSSQIKIDIICDKHGVFKQVPTSHLAGQGCPKCGGVGRTTQDFINDVSEIHNNKYDYSKTIYEKYNKPISIICPIHGEFSQKPLIHIQGSGCQMCSESKGERKVTLFLEKNNINFTKQKTFDDCRNIKTNRLLKFDFYLPEHNLCIEYDGECHYFPWRKINESESKNNFEAMKKRDEIKNKYCVDNNIRLLRIPYFEIKNINKIISGYLYKKD